MDYHWDFNLKAGDLICIENHRPIEIMLLDDEKYEKYIKDGGVYCYQDHKQEISPIKIPIPSNGHWHLVIKNYEGEAPLRVTTKTH